MTAMLMRLAGSDDHAIPSAEQMQEILRISSEAATACCEKSGAMEAIPTLAEVEQRFKRRQHQGGQAKVPTLLLS